MARPRKQPEEQRSERFTVRFTAAERVWLEQQAATAGIADIAKLIRRRTLGLPVQPSRSKADAALLAALNRCGVNLNQIARNLNSGRRERLDVDTTIAELRGLIAQVIDDVPEDQETAPLPCEGAVS